MSSLAWILTATLLGAGLSAAAAALAARVKPTLVSMLISYAIGTLLGAAFLEVLPSALARSGDSRDAVTLWRSILAEAPADASWRPFVEDAIRALEPPGKPQPATGS